MAYVREGFDKDWRYRYRAKRAINQLQRRGLLVTETRDEQLMLKITQAGRRWLKRLEINQIVIERPKRWDGTWRVVIFDIPEKNRTVRDTVRRWLKRLGFARLQQSVWAIPWPCHQQCELLSSELMLGNQVLLVETEKIANERALKRIFKL
ncbi:CRISPR-associated endonuclease Cas2 [Candidatus Berkelbacteria bacterium]|nr:CRISPR-associated endonuclease Cas2 [Candidatus Berkelbacteria bacterium]